MPKVLALREPGMMEQWSMERWSPETAINVMNIFEYTFQKSRGFLAATALSASFLAGTYAPSAQTTNTNSAVAVVSEADKAWKELQKALRPPMPPAEWQGKRPTPEEVKSFRLQQGQLAGQAADK